jgi:anti-anti-sigma factor
MRQSEPANVVRLEGEWDLARREELEGLLGRLTVNGEATIDLRGCTYADSTVLSALAILRVKFTDTPVTLLGPSPQLRRVLRIARFDRLFKSNDEDPPSNRPSR